ncbi:MAG: hypothetical protein ACRDBM_14650 [Sporomusa sp.]
MSRDVMNMLNIVGQLADLKDVDYRNTLAVAALIGLLIEKKLFTRQEFSLKTQQLECSSLAEFISKKRTELKVPH